MLVLGFFLSLMVSTCSAFVVADPARLPFLVRSPRSRSHASPVMNEEMGDNFSDASMRRMAQRLDDMLGRQTDARVRVPQKQTTTSFIDENFVGREELLSARQRAPAALSALMEKLEQLPQAEATVTGGEDYYIVTCKAPGTDTSKLEVSTDGNTLIIIGQTTVMDDQGTLEVGWRLPVELPPDADLSQGSSLTMRYEDEVAFIEVPNRSRSSASSATLSEAELQRLSVRELKRRLTELSVPFYGVIEKRELQELLRSALAAQNRFHS